MVKEAKAATNGELCAASIIVSDHKTGTATGCALTRKHGDVVLVAQPPEFIVPFDELSQFRILLNVVNILKLFCSLPRLAPSRFAAGFGRRRVPRAARLLRRAQRQGRNERVSGPRFAAASHCNGRRGQDRRQACGRRQPELEVRVCVAFKEGGLLQCNNIAMLLPHPRISVHDYPIALISFNPPRTAPVRPLPAKPTARRLSNNRWNRNNTTPSTKPARKLCPPSKATTVYQGKPKPTAA